MLRYSVVDDSIYYAIDSTLENWHKPAIAILDEDAGYIAFCTSLDDANRIAHALNKANQ